jgi:hypothetical protein
VSVTDPNSGVKLKDDLENSRALLAEYKEVVAVEQAQADRFTTQGRQAFLYVTTFFTIAQAAAVASLSQHLGSSGTDAVVGIALASSVGMVATGYFAFAVERLRSYGPVGRKFLARVPDDAAQLEISVELQLSRGYKKEAEELEGVLQEKRKWLGLAQGTAAITFVLIAGELMTALAERL